ncbi:hypothetical protein VaNZ11_006985 [Volvox africanus]|uniref:Uncharacterized protein n=1 Tax=Volvox africanus TaxID=51714 RepID=A0ABQ5S2A7_9CHLO|nr:hypothetical protein VaNZ11_006985 [Volvox africanus]
MPFLVLAAGSTIVLALRLASRFLRQRNQDSEEDDLFFPDEDVEASTSCQYGGVDAPRAGAPFGSYSSTSGLEAHLPEQRSQYGSARVERTKLTKEDIQVLTGFLDAGASLPGESGCAIPADLLSISSGEARRRAASVRKVRDWDDSGGSRDWATDTDGRRAGSGMSHDDDDCGGGGGHSDGEERQGMKDAPQLSDGSAASSTSRPGPRSQPAPSNRGIKQVAKPQLNTGGSSGGCGSVTAATIAGDVEGTGDRALSAGRLRTGSGAAAAEGSLGLQVSCSSVLANCSHGSGTDTSVPFRSCGTGTATLTSSSSPGTSQSTEGPELRSDTDSEKLRQKSQEHKQHREKEKQSRRSNLSDSGDIVAEVLAAGKVEQAAALAADRAAVPVVFTAQVEEVERPGELPLALRSSSPPSVPPPPPPLPPTIVAIRVPDPQSLLAIQRQVDALRLQHLQRQAQALMAMPLASRGTQLASTNSAGAAAAALRSPSPASVQVGSVGSISGSGGGGGGALASGTPASPSPIGVHNSGGGRGDRDSTQRATLGGGGRGSPRVGLPSDLHQQVDDLLEDMARRQQQQQQQQQILGYDGDAMARVAGGLSRLPQQHTAAVSDGAPAIRTAACALPAVPGLSLTVGGGGCGASGVDSCGNPAVAGASVRTPSVDNACLPPTSAFATVQNLLLKSELKNDKTEMRQLQKVRADWEASQLHQGGGNGQVMQKSDGGSPWPLEAVQTALMSSLQKPPPAQSRQSFLQPRSTLSLLLPPPPPPQQQQQQQQSPAAFFAGAAARGIRPREIQQQQSHQPALHVQPQPHAVAVAEATAQTRQKIPALSEQLYGADPAAGQFPWTQPRQSYDIARAAALQVAVLTPDYHRMLWDSSPQRDTNGGGGDGDGGSGFFQPASGRIESLPMPTHPASSFPPTPSSKSQTWLQQQKLPQLTQLSQLQTRPQLSQQLPPANLHLPPEEQQQQPGPTQQRQQQYGNVQCSAQNPAVMSPPRSAQRHQQLGQEPASPVTGRGSAGNGITPAEMLCSPPSFRHHLRPKEQAQSQQYESVKRTEDWLNSTPTRVDPTRGSSAYNGGGEDVTLQVLRPHPPMPALTPGGPGSVSFPFMSHSQPLPFLQLQVNPQHSQGTPQATSSAPTSPLRRQDTLYSAGGASSHGSRRTSPHGSRHTSAHGSRRRESSAARRRRELQQLQEKLANQPPPSALAMLSAKMLVEAGERMVPAPKTPGGRAFFVPLKHELRLEMSEQPSSSRLSDSQTSTLGFGSLPTNFTSAGPMMGGTMRPDTRSRGVANNAVLNPTMGHARVVVSSYGQFNGRQ